MVIKELQAPIRKDIADEMTLNNGAAGVRARKPSTLLIVMEDGFSSDPPPLALFVRPRNVRLL